MSPHERNFNDLLTDARAQFFKELGPKIEQAREIVTTSKPLSRSDMQSISRIFHNIYGTSSTLSLDHIADLAKETGIAIKKFEDIPSDKSFRLNEIVSGVLDTLADFNASAGELKVSGGSYVEGYTNLQSTGTILLIDDDLVMLKLLESAFSLEGYTVYICDQSEAAMDMITLTKPDIILLDIKMPKIDGYDILHRIRANPNSSDICVIFLSAMDQIDDKIKGMSAGIDDYITKPFDIREVISRVEMVLKRANKFKEKLLKDSLTGAYSRCYMHERLRDEMERFKRKGIKFSLAFLDLDFFKGINDKYGHVTGDYVLRKFVEYTMANLRESDCLFRYGGEEFVILLPDTDEDQAYLAIERLREGFSSTQLSFGGNTFSVSFSSGVKEININDKNIKHLLSMTDKAMYVAKRAGRNKVVKFSYLHEEDLNKKTLLLVDDENTILKMLQDRFTEIGYNAVLASDGSKALEIANRLHIDAVVLDLILPDMSGLDVCREIRLNSINRNTRIIILSKKSEERDIVDGLNCGADDYVKKPFSLAELEARILRVLSR